MYRAVVSLITAIAFFGTVVGLINFLQVNLAYKAITASIILGANALVYLVVLGFGGARKIGSTVERRRVVVLVASLAVIVSIVALIIQWPTLLTPYVLFTVTTGLLIGLLLLDLVVFVASLF